jgi:hypothetical protein
MPVSTTTDKLVIEVLIKPGTPTLRISANSAHRGTCDRHCRGIAALIGFELCDTSFVFRPSFGALRINSGFPALIFCFLIPGSAFRPLPCVHCQRHRLNLTDSQLCRGQNGQLSIEHPMNVSWSDVNQVQEAGDYSFRDGILTVTFAEIAVWKADPGACFQLMHKHPIRTDVRYVLGRQIDAPAATEEQFYKSSDGDSWSLTRDTLTGVRCVIHRPNTQSGGRTSQVQSPSF